MNPIIETALVVLTARITQSDRNSLHETTNLTVRTASENCLLRDALLAQNPSLVSAVPNSSPSMADIGIMSASTATDQTVGRTWLGKDSSPTSKKSCVPTVLNCLIQNGKSCANRLSILRQGKDILGRGGRGRGKIDMLTCYITNWTKIYNNIEMSNQLSFRSLNSELKGHLSSSRVFYVL